MAERACTFRGVERGIGSIELVRTLLRHLIDEIQVMIELLVAEGGKRLFAEECA